jgi:hypothetical protein
MGLVVTGISSQADLHPLESALTAAGLSLEPLSVVDSDDESLPFTQRSSLATGSVGPIETGTGVPGLTDSRPVGLTGGAAAFGTDTLVARLGELEIPDDELENYLEAIAAGRRVVAYLANAATIEQVEGVFRAAGLAKVKRF